MKIKKNRRREWARLLVKTIIMMIAVIMAIMLLKLQRIEGNQWEPVYRDGDLVLKRRIDDVPFALLRVRGCDD